MEKGKAVAEYFFEREPETRPAGAVVRLGEEWEGLDWEREEVEWRRWRGEREEVGRSEGAKGEAHE